MSTTIDTTTVPEITVATEQEEYRRDVLLRAAELIETHGWATGSAGLKVNGPYCILGAVGAAMHAPFMENRTITGQPVYDMPYAAELIATGVPWNVFTHWNDQCQPGGAKVAKVLRQMANGVSFGEAASLD